MNTLLLLLCLLAPVPDNPPLTQAWLDVHLCTVVYRDTINPRNNAVVPLVVYEDRDQFKTNDVIKKVASKEVATEREVKEVIKLYRPGDVVDIELIRGGKNIRISVKLK